MWRSSWRPGDEGLVKRLRKSDLGIALGVRRFDASVGGLGGFRFAPDAADNLATENLALMAGNLVSKVLVQITPPLGCGLSTEGGSMAKRVQSVDDLSRVGTSSEKSSSCASTGTRCKLRRSADLDRSRLLGTGPVR